MPLSPPGVRMEQVKVRPKNQPLTITLRKELNTKETYMGGEGGDDEGEEGGEAGDHLNILPLPSSFSHPPPHHSLPCTRRRRSRTLKRAGREGGSVMPSPGVAQRVPLLPRHLLLTTNASANFTRGTLDSLSPSTPHLRRRRAFPCCYSSRMTLEQFPNTSMPP